MKLSYETYKIALPIAIKAINQNRFRSLLTAMGIIFGVAAVIAMMAVGAGAQQEIMEQIKLVGVNNIIISKKVLNENSSQEEIKKMKYAVGLSERDLEFIQTMPSVSNYSPLLNYSLYTINEEKGASIPVFGVNEKYFSMFNINLIEGQIFNNHQVENSSPVCLLGLKAKTKLFGIENPVGKKIKCGSMWLTVLGVVKLPHTNLKENDNIGFKNDDYGIYIPYSTLLIRQKDRSVISKTTFTKKSDRRGDEKKENKESISFEYSQFDKIIVQVEKTELLNKTAGIISRNLQRRHNDVVDYEIEIPELLLKQQQKSKDVFNIVLGLIAGISLLIGGIGIMNIMLASVMERVKEIGLRAALGATKNDIVMQFLTESVLISVVGGLIGVVLGMSIAKSISLFTGIKTIITFLSVFVSFAVSVSIGLFFGIMPAKKASEQKPIESLRS